MWIQGVKYLMSAIKYTVIIALLYRLADSKIEEKIMEVSMSNDCVCPDGIVTYECTVVGDMGGITLWMGDFFHCPNGKREIELLHSDFTNGQGGKVYTTRICNDGNIVGRIVRVENGTYTSQLNVTLTSNIAGKSIECSYDNSTVHRVGSLNITEELIAATKSISRVSTFCPPSDIHFSWDALPLDCRSTPTYYNILASDCGSCPNTTNRTNVICTDVPANSSMCEFFVQSAICSTILLNITMTPMCPGEDDSEIHLMAVILPLTVLLLLLAVVILLSLHIFKERSCQKTLHRNAEHKEQKGDNYDRNSQIEDDTKATKIFDNRLNGTYNLVELDIIQTEQESGRKSQDDNDIEAIIKTFDNRLNGIYNLVEPDIIHNKQKQESVQGGSIQDKLTLNNLMIRLQGRISSHWCQFGLALGVPNGVLEQLKDYSDEDALVEILDYWLKNHPFSQPTWQDVATALKKAGFNNVNVE